MPETAIGLAWPAFPTPSQELSKSVEIGRVKGTVEVLNRRQTFDLPDSDASHMRGHPWHGHSRSSPPDK